MVQKTSKGNMTPAERNRDLEREAAERGFKPLTREDLARLAVGTPEESEDLVQVSAEVRRRGRGRRRQ